MFVFKILNFAALLVIGALKTSHIPRNAFLLWRAIKGQPLTKDKLVNFSVINDSGSLFYDGHNETMDHMFLTCDTPIKFQTLCLTFVNWYVIPWLRRTTFLC